MRVDPRNFVLIFDVETFHLSTMFDPYLSTRYYPQEDGKATFPIEEEPVTPDLFQGLNDVQECGRAALIALECRVEFFDYPVVIR